MYLGELQMAKTVTMRMRREAIFWSLFCLSVCFALIRLDSWRENGQRLRTFWGVGKAKTTFCNPFTMEVVPYCLDEAKKKDIHDFMLLFNDLSRTYYTYIILLQQAQSYE